MRGHQSINSFYIAASSQEIDRAKKWRAALEHAGIVCTSRWIETIEATTGQLLEEAINRMLDAEGA